MDKKNYKKNSTLTIGAFERSFHDKTNLYLNILLNLVYSLNVSLDKC
jgi:hypothetical protein